MTATIRRYRPSDRDALADVCVRTADVGSDATGLLTDDALWPALFLDPYLERHPDLAFTVEQDGVVAGYTVCAPDTADFEAWFGAEWWPAHAERWPHPGDVPGREADLVRYAFGRGGATAPYVAAHPAHLHIDLLPSVQGRGWGRRLIDTLLAALVERDVPGVHLEADPANAGALAFYERLGFARVPGPADSAAFVRPLR